MSEGTFSQESSKSLPETKKLITVRSITIYYYPISEYEMKQRGVIAEMHPYIRNSSLQDTLSPVCFRSQMIVLALILIRTCGN